MKYIFGLILVLFLIGCYRAPKINEDVENMMDQEFILDSLVRSDTLGDLSAFQNRINYIVIHTFASKDGRPWTRKEMDNLWKSYGWSRGGYHMVIQPNGDWTIDMPVVDEFLSYEEIRNGVKYHNHESIHLSWIGGYSGKDTRTEAQRLGMLYMVKMLKAILPNAEVIGHTEFPGVSKSCPNFDASEEYSGI